MYTVAHIQNDDLDYLELKHSKHHTKAVIQLNEGARLDQLVIDDIKVIVTASTATYKTNYASAILFPFANRIKNGAYTVNGDNYQLNCNEIVRNNAMHGLVYDKSFTFIDSKATSDLVEVKLNYAANGKSKGFPFKYTIELLYSLNKDGISLTVNIINTDKQEFPFTLGWHPYFETKDLYNSHLNFTSNAQFLVDKQFIPTQKVEFKKSMPFQLKDTKFDDGFQLQHNQVEFLTPEYKLQLTSSSEENYLQLYTPIGENCIAIEPMTGLADSFNNKLGLQTLKPNASYQEKWSVSIKHIK